LQNKQDYFFSDKFTLSKYFLTAIPIIYFIIMLIVCLTNRLLGDYGVETDFYVAFVSQAKELLNGNLLIDEYRGPVYQILLAVTGFFFKSDFYTAGKFLNVLCAAMVLFFVSKLITSLFNRQGAFFVILFIAVNQIFWRYTYEPGTDMLFLVFYVSSLYFLLKDLNFESKNLFTAGLLSGMAYLTRYTGVSLLVFAVILFAIIYFKKYKNTEAASGKNFLKPVLFYLIPVLILISGWGIFSFVKTGNFFYNKNYQNTAFAFYKPNEMSKDEWTSKHQETYSSMSDVIFSDPITFVKRIGKNSITYFTKDLLRFFPKYISIFAGLGFLIFLLKLKSENLQEKLFLLAGFIFYIQILLIFYSERFSLPLLPLYSFLIIRLFSQDFIQRFNFEFKNLKLFSLILLLLFSLNFYSSYSIAKEDLNNVPVEILTVRDFVKKDFSEELKGKSIMARKPHIAYYLDMELVFMPYAETYADFIKNLKKSNAEYLFVSEKEGMISSNEELKKNLLNTTSFNNEVLEIITYTADPVTVLYKVK